MDDRAQGKPADQGGEHVEAERSEHLNLRLRRQDVTAPGPDAIETLLAVQARAAVGKVQLAG
jgi:hypothetical protein